MIGEERLLFKDTEVLVIEDKQSLLPMHIYFLDMDKFKDGISRLEDVLCEW